MTILKCTITVFAVAVFTSCRGDLVKVKSCIRNPSDEVIKIKFANVDPLPIQIPGNVTLSLAIEVTKAIDGNLRVEIIVKKQVLFGWITIPCFNNKGSCNFQDLCSFLQSLTTKDCPDVPKEMNISCSSAVAARTYTLPHCSLSIDLGIFGFNFGLLSGEYRASIRFINSKTLKEVGCYEAEGRIIDPPRPNIFKLF